MRKLLLGVGVMMVGRYLARHAPQGWRRHLSLRALAGAMLAGAAHEVMGRSRKPAPAVPPQTV